MNVLDIAIMAVLIIFIAAGFKNGVIKETVSLVGIIIVFVLAWSLREIIGNMLCLHMPFYAMNGYTFLNVLLYQGLGFLLTFLILLGIFSVLLGVSSAIQKIVNATIILLIPSKLLGAFVSFLKGYIIVFIILLIAIIPFGSNSLIRESKLVNKIVYNSPVLSKYTEKITKPAKEINDLIDKATHDKITKDEVNIEGLKIMMRYNVVSQKVIAELKGMHRFDNIVGINSVIFSGE